MNTSFGSLRLVNTYGAFGSITRRRFEVVVQVTPYIIVVLLLRYNCVLLLSCYSTATASMSSSRWPRAGPFDDHCVFILFL